MRSPASAHPQLGLHMAMAIAVPHQLAECHCGSLNARPFGSTRPLYFRRSAVNAEVTQASARSKVHP